MTTTVEREGVSVSTDEKPAEHVIEALSRVIRDLPGIGKDQHASQQQGGYAYRGIEQITQAVQPLFARHGIVFVPRVVDWQPAREISVNNKPWTDERILVTYRVFGPAGLDDYIDVGPIPSIGRDNSDKGSNKCMTQAFKYALIQALCIADPVDDADGTTAAAEYRQPEESPVPATEAEVIAVLERLRPLHESLDGYPEAWKEARAEDGKIGTYRIESLEAMVTGDKPMTDQRCVTLMGQILDLAEAEQLAGAPCALCGSERSIRVLVGDTVRCSNANACEKRAAHREEGHAICVGCGEGIPADGTEEARNDLVLAEDKPWHRFCAPDEESHEDDRTGDD